MAVEVARRGYDTVRAANGPPSVGTKLPRLRLTRPRRSVDELEARITGVFAVMGLTIPPMVAVEWSKSAFHSVVKSEEAIVSEPMPGVVVTYDAHLDDLSVIHWALSKGAGRVDTSVSDFLCTKISHL
ncbi:MAG: hypothetical protein AAGF11_25745 [Myxococcota bacterium]